MDDTSLKCNCFLCGQNIKAELEPEKKYFYYDDKLLKVVEIHICGACLKNKVLSTSYFEG